MAEGMRHQWIYTIHHSASIHDTITDLTNQRKIISEQQIDLGKSGRRRDLSDLQMMGCFTEHNPISEEIEELRLLSTGPTTQDADVVNCHDAELSDAQIKASLDGDRYNDAKINRSQQFYCCNNFCLVQGYIAKPFR